MLISSMCTGVSPTKCEMGELMLRFTSQMTFDPAEIVERYVTCQIPNVGFKSSQILVGRSGASNTVVLLCCDINVVLEPWDS